MRIPSAVFNCSAYFLHLLAGPRIEVNRLHRLLYISQGFAIAQGREVLFDDEIEAWLNGPVVPTLYDVQKNAPWIDARSLGDYSALSFSDAKFLRRIWDVYGLRELVFLDRESQQSEAWREARRSLETGGSGLISVPSLKKHFAEAMRRYEEQSST